MRRPSQRGYIGLFLLLAVSAAALLIYVYGLQEFAPQAKSPLEMQIDALQQAKAVQNVSDTHNKDIEAAMRED